MKLKALSVRPPWGQLIIFGSKRIENRMRKTNHRGFLAIHSSKTPSDMVEDVVFCIAPSFEPGEMEGAVFGIVEVVDCLPWDEAQRQYPEHYAWINTTPGTWCWVLARPRLLKRPFKVRGMPGLFEVDIPDDLLPESFLEKKKASQEGVDTTSPAPAAAPADRNSLSPGGRGVGVRGR